MIKMSRDLFREKKSEGRLEEHGDIKRREDSNMEYHITHILPPPLPLPPPKKTQLAKKKKKNREHGTFASSRIPALSLECKMAEAAVMCLAFLPQPALSTSAHGNEGKRGEGRKCERIEGRDRRRRREEGRSERGKV